MLGSGIVKTYQTGIPKTYPKEVSSPKQQPLLKEHMMHRALIMNNNQLGSAQKVGASHLCGRAAVRKPSGLNVGIYSGFQGKSYQIPPCHMLKSANADREFARLLHASEVVGPKGHNHNKFVASKHVGALAFVSSSEEYGDTLQIASEVST